MFKNQLMKRAVVALLLVAFLPILPSCTDDEVATGAAVVAVGAAAVSIGAAVDANHDRDRRDRRYDRPRRRPGRCGYGYRMACRTYIDYYGRTRQTCQCVRTGYGYRAYIDMEKEMTAEEFSVAYSMSLESAKKFQEAINEANDGSLAAINELGLSKKDMNLLARLRMPSDESIEELAKNLDQDPIFARSMISKMIIFGHKQREELCEDEDNAEKYQFCK
jgi:hypothetical protein